MIRSPLPCLSAALLAALTVAANGCLAEAETTVEAQGADIVEGDFATEYPEAVHVNALSPYRPAGSCSGALLAARVVLTAAHCVADYEAWGIYAPFADEQGTMTSHAEIYDWSAGGGFDPVGLDIAVVLLDEDIVLDHYPVLAEEPFPSGTEAVIVGRTNQGFVSSDWLFASRPVRLYQELPNEQLVGRYYYTEKMIQKGDSGGPVFALDADRPPDTPRTIAAVVSTMHYVARVEVAHEWIRSFLPE